MSYQGQVQRICEHGHFFSVDCYDDQQTCYMIRDGKACGARAVWSNSVDETNTSPGQGYIAPAKLAKLAESEEKTCPTCNNTEILNSPTYKVPTPEEAERLRSICGPQYCGQCEQQISLVDELWLHESSQNGYGPDIDEDHAPIHSILE